MGRVKIRPPFSTPALSTPARYGIELVPENGERGAGARWAQPRSKRHPGYVWGSASRKSPCNPPSSDGIEAMQLRWRLCCASQCAVHHSRAMGHLLCLGA